MKCESCLEIHKLLTAQDDIKLLHSRLTTATATVGRLAEFARHVIEVECWAVDGADIQEKAEELGLIVPHTATKEDVDDESDFEVGDTIFKFSETLQEPEGDTT